MYEMLKEWQVSPRQWRKEGFHRYDPQTYAVGKDVLFLNHPDLKIVYRRLSNETSSSAPLFQEFFLYRENSAWKSVSQTVTFMGSEKRVVQR